MPFLVCIVRVTQPIGAMTMRILKTLAMAAAMGTLSTAALAQANCVLPGNALQLEATIGAGLNQVRQSQSLGTLSANGRLTDAARIHACDMALNNFSTIAGRTGPIRRHASGRKAIGIVWLLKTWPGAFPTPGRSSTAG